MKQTAVQWLEEQLDNLLKLYPSEIQKVNSLFQQAKEIEKKRIIDAYEQGIEDGYWHPENGYNKKYDSAEQYYSETFKQNN